MTSDPRQTAHPAARACRTEFRVNGLRREIGRICALLSDPGLADPAPVRERIERLSRVIERGMAWRGLGAGALTAPTREARGWLAFFADADHLALYREAVRTAEEIFREALRGQRRFRLPVRIEFRPQHALAWIRGEADGARVPCCTPAVAFDRPAFEALAENLLHRRRSRTLHEAMLGEGYQRVDAALDALAGVPERAAGRHHDLAASFDRVNRSLLGGSMDQPRLAWTRAPTRRILGHYEAVRDTVLISATLDRTDVPEPWLDYVMYHELLHRRHGLRWTRGQARAHTPAFRADERRFPDHARAEAGLKQVLARACEKGHTAPDKLSDRY